MKERCHSPKEKSISGPLIGKISARPRQNMSAMMTPGNNLVIDGKLNYDEMAKNYVKRQIIQAQQKASIQVSRRMRSARYY